MGNSEAQSAARIEARRETVRDRVRRVRRRVVMWSIGLLMVGSAILGGWYLTASPHADARRLLAELRNAQPGVFEQTRERLGGDPAPAARAPLVIVREMVALGPAAEGALREALEDEKLQVRCYALVGLSKLRPLSQETVAALREALRDSEPAVRRGAIEILREIRPADEETIDALLPALKDEDSWVRTSAALALRDLGPLGPQAVPHLLEAMADEEETVRSPAADALAEMGEAAAQAAPGLAELLRTTDDRRCVHVIRVLATISRHSPAASQHLGQAMRHRSPWARIAAAEALQELGPVAARATADLLAAATDKTSFALEALYAAGASPDQLLPLIRAALADPARFPANQAVAVLGQMAGDGVDVAPDLGMAMGHNSPVVRVLAALTLLRTQKRPATVAALAWMLDSEDPQRQRQIVEQLKEAITEGMNVQELAARWWASTRSLVDRSENVPLLSPKGARQAVRFMKRVLKATDHPMTRPARPAYDVGGPSGG